MKNSAIKQENIVRRKDFLFYQKNSANKQKLSAIKHFFHHGIVLSQMGTKKG